MAYAQIGLSCRAPIEQTYNNAIHGMKQELPKSSLWSFLETLFSLKGLRPVGHLPTSHFISHINNVFPNGKVISRKIQLAKPPLFPKNNDNIIFPLFAMETHNQCTQSFSNPLY